MDTVQLGALTAVSGCLHFPSTRIELLLLSVDLWGGSAHYPLVDHLCGVGMTSRWYKCDLQVATPAWKMKIPAGKSYDFGKPNDRAAFADVYMAHLKKRGIEVIALADHHTSDWIDDMRAAGERAGVTVFPGVEVTTGSGADGAHLVLIGDLSKTASDVEILLAKVCGFDEGDNPRFNPARKKEREPAPAPHSIGDILNQLPDGWLAFAPHVLGENGLASPLTAKGTIRWKALHHDRLSAIDVGHSQEDNELTDGNHVGFNRKFRARDRDDFPCLKRLAFISTSDAYDVEDLGSRFTWIRMSEPSLEGLRQAFLDYEARIICDWDERLVNRPDPNRVDHAWIESVNLGGTLGNSASPLSVTFDPRLNVIIGGRGSGKSTIVAALRQLYGTVEALPASLRGEAEDFVKRIFDSADLTSTHHLAISNERQQARWTAKTGSTTDRAAINTATTFPVRLFGQKELYERIKSDTGDPYVASRNLLTLVDEAVVAAGDGPRPDFDEARAAIEDRCERAVRGRQRLQMALSRREDLTAQVAELRQQVAVLDSPDLRERRERNARLMRERAELESIATTLDQTIIGIRNRIAELLTPPGSPSHDPSDRPGTRAAHLRNLDDIRTQLLNDMLTAIGHAEAASKNAQAARRQGLWAEQVEQAVADDVECQAELAAIGVDPEQYLGLRDELSSAEQALAELESQRTQLAQRQTEESDAWDALAALYDGRRHRRSHLVEVIRQRSASLRFELSAHGDWAGWAARTRELLNLRSDGFIADVRAVARWLWSGAPELLAQRLRLWRNALLDVDPDAYRFLEQYLSEARKGWWERLRRLDPAIRLRLATLMADDVITMRFLRADGRADRDQDWQDVSHGSPGQRSAAMLSFVLHQGTEPLVLDQPEDDLDTALISQLIVEELRKSRWNRQVIVVTHNANIPVLSDAEQIIVLEAHEQTLQIKQSHARQHVGPIEVAEVRQEIQEVMEGGVAAFITREKRYDNELSMYRRDINAVSQARAGR